MKALLTLSMLLAAFQAQAQVDAPTILIMKGYTLEQVTCSKSVLAETKGRCAMYFSNDSGGFSGRANAEVAGPWAQKSSYFSPPKENLTIHLSPSWGIVRIDDAAGRMIVEQVGYGSNAQ